MVNYKELKEGQVLYYIERDKNSPYAWKVDFGLVEDIFTDGVVLTMFTPKETRMINGVPYNNFVTPTKWMKLPKGWTYNTKLFELDYEDVSDYCPDKIRIDKPNDIIDAINNGWIIEARDKDWSHIEAEIDKVHGYRLIRKTNYGEYHPSTKTFRYDNVYYTYADAKDVINAIYEEMLRVSNLSDYDWSLELITKDVKRWSALYCDETVREEKVKKILDWFKSKEKLEEIETRVCGGEIQWKYTVNKKWNPISEDLM